MTYIVAMLAAVIVGYAIAKAFRERLEVQPSLFDHDDWGACSCMTPEDEPPEADDAEAALAREIDHATTWNRRNHK